MVVFLYLEKYRTTGFGALDKNPVNHGLNPNKSNHQLIERLYWHLSEEK